MDSIGQAVEGSDGPRADLLEGQATGWREASRSSLEARRYWGLRVVVVRCLTGAEITTLCFLCRPAAAASFSSEGKGGEGFCPVWGWPSMVRFDACSMADSSVTCRGR